MQQRGKEAENRESQRQTERRIDRQIDKKTDTQKVKRGRRFNKCIKRFN